MHGIPPSRNLSSRPDSEPSIPRIDAHHHLWHYTQEEYGWIDEESRAIRRDFLPGDLTPLLETTGVAGTVAVQARQTIDETEWLLSLAAAPDSRIKGVVGWLPIAADNFPSLLGLYLHQPLLKGLRHIVQAEPDGFLDDKNFNRGIDALCGTGLVYDVLIYAHQLEEAARFVDRHPEQNFVLDHIAKPRIHEGEIVQWSKGFRELARRDNVCCKLSGMVTEAGPAHWTEAQLKPYFEVALEAFTPSRLMVGTDWPVLAVGCEYTQWWQIIEHWIAPLTASEQSQILGATAARVYRLQTAAGE